MRKVKFDDGAAESDGFTRSYQTHCALSTQGRHGVLSARGGRVYSAGPVGAFIFRSFDPPYLGDLGEFPRAPSHSRPLHERVKTLDETGAA